MSGSSNSIWSLLQFFHFLSSLYVIKQLNVWVFAIRSNLKKLEISISIIQISSPILGGSEWRHPADMTPRGPRLSLITTVSHYPPCGGRGGSGNRKHHPPIFPQWADKRHSEAWTQANFSVLVAMHGRCLGESMKGYRSGFLIKTIHRVGILRHLQCDE